MKASSLVVLAALVAVVTCSIHAIESFKNENTAKALRHENSAKGLRHEQSEASLTCYTLSCVGVGGNCTIVIDYEREQVTSAPVCIDSTCPTSQPKLCQALPSLPGHGETCSRTTGCSGVLTCNEYSSTCIYINEQLGAGSSCSSDSECRYTNSYQSCSSGVCRGQAVGSSCTEDEDCSGFATCASGTCVAVLQIGAACQGSASCFGGSCINSVCVEDGTVTVGNTCYSSEACADNLFCNTTSYECQSAISSGNQACTTTADCPNGNECACNFGTGTTSCQVAESEYLGNPSGTAAKTQAFYSCVKNNNVYDIPNSIKRCKAPTCNYIQSLSSSLLSFNNYPKCFVDSLVGTNPYTSLCQNSSNVLSASILLLIVAVFASLL